MAESENPKKKPAANWGTGIAIGVAIGAGTGVAMGNPGLGLAIGVAIGAALAVAFGASDAKGGRDGKHHDEE